MDMSTSKEGGRSAKIVPGPNGISGDVFDGDFLDSFSSFLAGNGAGQGLPPPSMEVADGNTDSTFAKGLEKRISLGKSVTKDSEICIFQAEKYFSSVEEKRADANHESTKQSSKPRENSKARIQASKDKVLLSSNDLYDSGNRIPSPASSIGAVNRTFRPGGATPTTSSEASWNSQSALLSTAAGISVHKLASSERKRQSTRWPFGCTCPCWNKKSVEIKDAVTENRRSPCVTSTALMDQDSQLSSIKYTYAGLGKRVLCRSIEKEKTRCSVDNASEISDISSCVNGGSGIQTLINPVNSAIEYNIPQADVFKDKEVQNSFMVFDRDSDQEELGEAPRLRRIKRSSLVKEDGFSFRILPEKCEETPRQSMDVFGSPFPGTPDREETPKPTSGIANPHQRQPSDLDKRSLLCYVEKSRKSFSIKSKSESHKLTGPDSNADGDKDKESDSSSDLFEIESFTTQGTPCCASTRKDSVDDISSIQSGYLSTTFELGFHNSFHFGGMGEALEPSPQSFFYEPSEASVDWSVARGDTRDSMGKLTSDYEDTKKCACLLCSDLSRLRDAGMKGSSKRRSSTSNFMGCTSEESVR